MMSTVKNTIVGLVMGRLLKVCLLCREAKRLVGVEWRLFFFCEVVLPNITKISAKLQKKIDMC